MKIVKHIPNTITSMNLFFGVMGVIVSFSDKGGLETAFLFMLAAAVCDFCDGLSARLLKAYSELGKQLDSLADMVSFGVLPSVMTYRLMAMTSHEGILCYIPLLIAVFSALRLGKFNIDERQTDNFIGLPTPACAMICGSFAYYVSHDPSSALYTWTCSRYFIPVCSIVLSALLVSEIPMFSMKFKKDMKKGTPVYRQRICLAGIILVATLAVIVLGLNWSFIILLVFTSYIIMNVMDLLFFSRRRKAV
ncbi:MAG: CDP-diacylglycerol--serine O-phosphatidyltransferase [Bacteroidales bacterium]|nr:CDP-diacylglycerol--serine O-phosphatidyltransferase [Bacteroidales bacterium]